VVAAVVVGEEPEEKEEDKEVQSDWWKFSNVLMWRERQGLVWEVDG
jgi:hypothetical protein